MSDTVITVENLTKRYLLGNQRSKDDVLRHILEEALRDPLKWFRRRNKRIIERQEEFNALRNLTFEVNRAEILGVIGRNGAGKSTLLKVLSRITEPTSGRITIDGRVASLLEVGTGFHPELTGRENIYLNGAILGMSRVEIKRKFDEIVAFSEVERFLDTPVKRYSSGMYVRLAFAVAAHLEPEILIVDEVLAVGDLQFQAKCIGKMKQVASGTGRTVLFVSHNMMAVKSLCTRTIWLSNGQMLRHGPTEQVVDEYLKKTIQPCKERYWTNPKDAPGNDLVRIRKIELRTNKPDNTISVRDSILLTIEFENMLDNAQIDCCFHLMDSSGQIAFTGASFHRDGEPFPAQRKGPVCISCKIPGDLLNNGQYSADIQLNRDVGNVIFKLVEAISFEVQDCEKTRGGYHGVWPGAVRPILQWKINNARIQ